MEEHPGSPAQKATPAILMPSKAVSREASVLPFNDSESGSALKRSILILERTALHLATVTYIDLLALDDGWDKEDALAVAASNLTQIQSLIASDEDAFFKFMTTEAGEVMGFYDAQMARYPSFRIYEAFTRLTQSLVVVGSPIYLNFLCCQLTVLIDEVMSSKACYLSSILTQLQDKQLEVWATDQFSKECIQCTAESTDTLVKVANHQACHLEGLEARNSALMSVLRDVAENMVNIKAQLRVVMQELVKVQAQVGAGLSYAGKAAAASAASPSGSSSAVPAKGNGKCPHPADATDSGLALACKGKGPKPTPKKAQGG